MNWNNLDDIIVTSYENYFNENDKIVSTKTGFFKFILLPILRVAFIYGYMKCKLEEKMA